MTNHPRRGRLARSVRTQENVAEHIEMFRSAYRGKRVQRDGQTLGTIVDAVSPRAGAPLNVIIEDEHGIRTEVRVRGLSIVED